MNGEARIGVLGVAGAVGREAVRALTHLGRHRLLLGGRTTEALLKLRPSTGSADAVRVDVRDPVSLSSFVSACDLVLNCVGPAYELRATVPAAALAEGTHCVDVGGDDPAMEDLALEGAPPARGRSVVLSAGALPGLSSILPRWLARQGFDTVQALAAYSGGLEECSPTVAEDVMLSVVTGGARGAAYGESLAAWRNGHKQSRALRIEEDAVAPGFPDRAALQPYLSSEAERLAAYLALDRAEWFNTFPGPHVRHLLSRLPGRLAEGADRGGLTDRIKAAARVDLVGRTSYYVMDFTMSGTAEGRQVVRGLSMRAPSSYRLTATVGALAADAVLRGAVPPGVHFACDVLDPDAVVVRLRSGGIVERLELDHRPCEAKGMDHMVEEGVL